MAIMVLSAAAIEGVCPLAEDVAEPMFREEAGEAEGPWVGTAAVE